MPDLICQASDASGRAYRAGTGTFSFGRHLFWGNVPKRGVFTVPGSKSDELFVWNPIVIEKLSNLSVKPPK